MKRIVILLSCILSFLNVGAQQQEYIRLITDKDCYLAGEELWLKVCVSDKDNQPMDISKVAYIEVSDTEQVYAQAKIDLNNGWGSGRIQLPRTMPSGTFQLTAYTRYLRNWGEEAFNRQLIAVVNTLQSSDKDRVEWTDSLPSLPVATSSKLSSDKQTYNKRSKVVLSWKDLPSDAFGWTLSVVRKDYALGGVPQPASYTPVSQPQAFPWIAECEGHIVQATLTNPTVQTRTTRMGCVGKDIRMFEGKVSKEGKDYFFYTYGINNMQDIAFDAVLVNPEEKVRLDIVTPFAEIKAKELPILPLYSQEKALLERSVMMQVHTLVPDSSNSQSVARALHNFTPYITYKLDEWTRFNSVRETFIEFIPGIRSIKRGNTHIIQVFSEETGQFSYFKSLVLIDGVPIDNHEQALDYDARLLEYIHQYRGSYAFSGQIYDGIVSMTTYKGALNGLRLEENASLFAYEFPQKGIGFPMKDYSDEAEKASRVPDFRHTLYWNPSLEKDSHTVEFYTSDLKGTYQATLRGFTEKGAFWEEKVDFIVE